MTLPNDPIMLMSVLNTLLRDQYSSFAALCEDKDIDSFPILQKLKTAGYSYNAGSNRFE